MIGPRDVCISSANTSKSKSSNSLCVILYFIAIADPSASASEVFIL